MATGGNGRKCRGRNDGRLRGKINLISFIAFAMVFYSIDNRAIMRLKYAYF